MSNQWGRINRTTFWLAIGVIVIFYIVLNLLSTKPQGVQEFVLAMACVPRLHDIGKSAWWAFVAFVVEIVVVVGAFAVLPAQFVSLPVALFTLILAGLIIWLGLIPGDPLANRFGEPPSRGISYGKKSGPKV